jgi:hypothetical protein
MSKTATYSLIASNTVTGSPAANYTFSSIPATFTDLICVVDGTTTSLEDITAQYNGDTGNNYSYTAVIGSGSAASSGRQSNQPQILIGGLGTVQGGTIFNFIDYSNTTTFKTALSRVDVANWSVSAKVSLWRSTAAINAIKFAHPYSFAVGSTFKLYGIQAGSI